MSNEQEHGEEYQAFYRWYEENPTLVEDLQTWVFYRYALAEGKEGDVEVQVDVKDMAVYLELFYLSSLSGNYYTIETSVETMAQILETDSEVILDALDSLRDHGLLDYWIENGNLTVDIEPITTETHYHSHDHHDDHTHSH